VPSGGARDPRLYIGIMSGTSLDGADAVLAEFGGGQPHVLAYASRQFPSELRQSLLALSEPGSDSLDLAGEASLALADLYAAVVEEVVAHSGIQRREVRAIGCHGQTVRHRPALGFTIQLNDPARLAEKTGLDVVADFRRRDMAAGGEGAPLVPAFHEAVFRDREKHRCVVNIGGISNVTYLPPAGAVTGFDCGPGNVLLDGWIGRHQGKAFDDDGSWAASGRTDEALLTLLLAEPFLRAAPPKSTGRELFRMAWLDAKVDERSRPADVQSTLADFTATCIVDAIDAHAPEASEVFLAGGGARNHDLVRRIAGLAAPRKVDTTDRLGVPTGLVEPLAFAWLAMKCVAREPVDLSRATGARGPRILGAIYPA